MGTSKKDKNNFFNIYVASIGSFFTDISTEMVYPLIPIFLTTVLKAPASVLGLVEGIAESTAALLKVFSGYVSDYFQKRKPLTVFGYSLSVIGKLFLYLAGSWPVVLFARFVDRFGKGVRTAPRDALISESVGPEMRGRAFGLHRTFDTLGAASGVFISYLIIARLDKNVNLRSIFLISIIPALLGVVTLLFLREPKSKVKIEKPSVNLKSLEKRLLYFLAIAFLFSLGNSSDQFLLLKARKLGASVQTVLLIYLIYNLSYALLSYPAGRLSDVIGRRRVLVPGYLIYSAVYFLFARARVLSDVWIPFVMYGFYQAFTQGVERAIISDFSSEEVRATAIGAHAMITGAGLLPASLFAGYLWDRFGSQAAFYFGSLTSLLAALLMWLLLIKHEPGGR